jgi:hypothetical protein
MNPLIPLYVIARGPEHAEAIIYTDDKARHIHKRLTDEQVTALIDIMEKGEDRRRQMKYRGKFKISIGDVGRVIVPNPDFLSNVPYKTRRIWANRLRAPESQQCRDRMVEPINSNFEAFVKEGMLSRSRFSADTPMCCLMHGHVAFGGREADRTKFHPMNGPFVKAVDACDPVIALLKTKARHIRRIQASECNDQYKLTLTQIADLICPPDEHL